MTKLLKINFALILFVVLLRESISNPISPGEIPGCYKIGQNGTRFHFFCSSAQYLSNETCADATLSQAMQTFNASEVTELKMNGCRVNEVDFVLKKLENVSDVDISYMNYGPDGSIDWSILDVPTENKITKLNISHNSLTEVPGKITTKIPNLKVIDLSHNELSWISSFLFRNADEVMEIHLQHNQIEYSLKEFEHFTKLEFLDLSDNRIESIQDMNLPGSLKVLHLEHNPIGEFPCFFDQSERWLHSTLVHVSWKSVGNFNIRCLNEPIEFVIDNKEFIANRNGKLEIHCGPKSLAKLNTIEARSDQMQYLHEFVHRVGSALHSIEKFVLHADEGSQSRDHGSTSGIQSTEIDLMPLRQISRLKDIKIRNSHLKRVKNPSALQYMNLRSFDASGNQIENAREIVEYLNPSIEYLDLSGNSIGEVNAEIFKRLTNLQILRLRGTNMAIVDSSPFDHLKKLECIEISENDLSGAKTPILSLPLENLRFFFATDCRIRDAGTLFDSFGPWIEWVHLSGNFIGELNADTFKKVKRIEKLLMSNTSLSIGGSNPFESLERLRVLDISHNDLSNDNLTILSTTLPKLTAFIAVDCKITNAFDLLGIFGVHIEYIDLSDNFVGKVNFTTFNKFEQLWELNLRNTNLQIVDTELILRPMRLENLDISNNDLRSFDLRLLSAVLQDLWKFKAAGCQITKADDVLNYIGFELTELDLSENPFGEINLEKFRTFNRMEKLHLRNANLASFNFDALKNNDRFNFLDISFNHLNDLKISSTFSHLETLDLRGNGLMEIHNLNRQHLPKLRTLGISGNSLNSEFLEGINNEWTGLEFVSDKLKQTQRSIFESS